MEEDESSGECIRREIVEETGLGGFNLRLRGIVTFILPDCGKNIHFGKNVFINSGCRFQDQSGIYIGDNALIGHNVVLATLNHNVDPNSARLYHQPYCL